MPQFLSEASLQGDLSDFVIILQQHPGAKEKIIDGKLAQETNIPQLFISQLNSDDAQVVADGMLYYQTSMQGLGIRSDWANRLEDALIRLLQCQSNPEDEFSQSIPG